MVSHDDIDHSGGATSVLAQLPAAWLMSSFDLDNSLPQLGAKKSIQCFAGQTWLWDKVKFEVLSPTLASYDNTDIKDNNRSCVVKVTSQFGSLLLTGDIEKKAENALLEDVIESDVLIAPHHGSKTSSTHQFVQAVGARHVIFTVGYLNRFKHPKPLIVERFEDNGALTYRSDYQGALTIDFTKTNPIKISALRQSQPRYWHDKY